MKIGPKISNYLSKSPASRLFSSQTESSLVRHPLPPHSHSLSKERPSRKILPAKSVKFMTSHKITQQATQSLTPVVNRRTDSRSALGGTMPKPPLPKKADDGPMTSEAILKMADEGIS